MTEATVEFDHNAKSYDGLPRAPILERLVESSGFYHDRKWRVASEFLAKNAIINKRWFDGGDGNSSQLPIVAFSTMWQATVLARRCRARLREARFISRRLLSCYRFQMPASISLLRPARLTMLKERDRMPLTREIHRILLYRGIFGMIDHNPFAPTTRLLVKQCTIESKGRLLFTRRANSHTAEKLAHLEPHYLLREKSFAELVSRRGPRENYLPGSLCDI